MKFDLKRGSFFGKVIVGYKMKIKGVIENLKNFFLILIKNYNSKNTSRTCSGPFVDNVVSVHFQIVP